LIQVSVAYVAGAVTCSNGAEVAKSELCTFFYQFSDQPRELDPRIGLRVGVTNSDETRSMALIVGISSYPKIAHASILAAKIDTDRLKRFLAEDQKFDEVIVLENDDATAENINYFLNSYLPQRALSFAGKSRFLFAYSGHGIPRAGAIPASFVLSAATSASDANNLYSLAHLRTSLENLANSQFHVLALINACYGGNVFSPAQQGNPSVSYEPGSYALTAGSAEKPVASFGGPNDGSIFFDLIINGIKSGDADKDYPTLIDENGNVIQRGGVVRLGALANYLTTQFENIKPLRIPGESKPLKLSAPWIGPVETPPAVARGGFFFLSPITTTGQRIITVPPGPTSSLPGRPDIKVFGAAEEYPNRGITISQYEGEVDWDAVAKTGITFVYIRVGGSRGKDRMFAYHWRESAKRGLDRGAYIVYSYCHPVAAQVELIRSAIVDESPLLPTAIDVESYDFPGNYNPAEVTCARAASDEETRNRVFELAGQIQKLYGKTPMIYANRRILAKLNDARFDQYMVWLASYTKSGEPNSQLRLSGSNPWTLWQYTTTKVIDGIGDRCDSNVFFGTKEQYEAFKTGVGNVALEAAHTRSAVLRATPNR
jgi:lysozyme